MQTKPWKQTHSAHLTMTNKAWHPLLFNMTDCDITAHTSTTVPHSAHDLPWLQRAHGTYRKCAFQVSYQLCRKPQCTRSELRELRLLLGKQLCWSNHLLSGCQSEMGNEQLWNQMFRWPTHTPEPSPYRCCFGADCHICWKGRSST